MPAESHLEKTEEILIPELELERFQPLAPQANSGRLPVGSVRFGWVGAGMLGSRMAESFYRLGYEKTLAVSSDEKHLESLGLPKHQKCLWPAALPRRLHFAGAKDSPRSIGPDLFGRMEDVFGEEVDFLMLCLSEAETQGAGLFSSLMDLLTSYARLLSFRRPRRTAGIFWLPALHSSFSIPAHLHKGILPMVAVGTDTHRPTPKHTDPGALDRCARLFALFNQLSAQPTPYLTFDTGDYLDVLTAGGWTGIGHSRLWQPPDRSGISRAVRQALEQCTLGGRFSLKQTQSAACLMVGGPEMMAQTPGLPDVLLYGFDVLTALLGRARVHRGIYEDQDPSLRIYILLSGLQPQTC